MLSEQNQMLNQAFVALEAAEESVAHAKKNIYNSLHTDIISADEKAEQYDLIVDVIRDFWMTQEPMTAAQAVGKLTLMVAEVADDLSS